MEQNRSLPLRWKRLVLVDVDDDVQITGLAAYLGVVPLAAELQLLPGRDALRNANLEPLGLLDAT